MDFGSEVSLVHGDCGTGEEHGDSTEYYVFTST
jgi:hypothetical protein